MTDSSASSPMLLTPDTTGSDVSSAAAKKARRQTAFYPNTNSANKQQKPFSRSAAKRESVMALGSIEHLQHYFTKTGIAAKKNPIAIKGNLVPALGPLNHRTSDSVDDPKSPAFELPPTPMVRSNPQPPMPPHVRHYETDPETLLPGVVDDLTALVRVWHITADSSANNSSSSSDPKMLGATNERGSFDVLATLKITTSAIRSIRNYVVSLPDEFTGSIREQYRAKTLTASKLKASSAPLEKDPLTLIRKSALELLTVLRDLEERSRLPLEDDAYDVHSDDGHSRSGSSRVSSPMTQIEDLPSSDDADSEGVAGRIDPDMSVGYSMIQVPGRSEGVLVWEEEDELVWEDDRPPEEKRPAFEQRLVLGGGWLYKQDIRLSDLEKERFAVSHYLDVVDEVLFEGSPASGERGWDREKKKILQKGNNAKRRASEGGAGRPLPNVPRVSVLLNDSISEEPVTMDEIEEDHDGELSVDESELPEWARWSEYIDDDLGRAHNLLAFFLPPNLQPYLPRASPTTTFLESLTSGQLLCFAYNSCVRKSRKPWGFISKEGIHDIITLQKTEEPTEASKSGWTFRRIDNLRLWVGALKIRYTLPIQLPLPPMPTMPMSRGGGSSNPGTPLNSPTAKKFPSTEVPIHFDAKVVARKESGWEEMLRTVLRRWVEKVVEEKRSEGR
ncbi:hypothetical protein DL96DRAFT_504119 [Flagelloscypha sp. PMI_526]|nr:hypothetical protein DL96DRAFT_504119 [Flagelloscypha sp. PMI_526]